MEYIVQNMETGTMREAVTLSEAKRLIRSMRDKGGVWEMRRVPCESRNG